MLVRCPTLCTSVHVQTTTDIYYSHGNVATHFRCGWIFTACVFYCKFPRDCVPVIWKLVSILWSSDKTLLWLVVYAWVYCTCVMCVSGSEGWLQCVASRTVDQRLTQLSARRHWGVLHWQWGTDSVDQTQSGHHRRLWWQRQTDQWVFSWSF